MGASWDRYRDASHDCRHNDLHGDSDLVQDIGPHHRGSSFIRDKDDGGESMEELGHTPQALLLPPHR